MFKRLFTLGFLLISFASTATEDRVELDTTFIKGNTELPKILYVVPWKDIDGKSDSQQKLQLHSLFGDLFDPLTPDSPDQLKLTRPSTTASDE